jgi:hypothetical protein
MGQPRFPERNQQIIDLWSKSLSYGQIALRLGVTRSVVAGVLYRAGMKLDADESHARQIEGRRK